MQSITQTECGFDPDVLAAYVDGRLEPAELAAVDQHLDRCPSCRTEVSAMVSHHTAPAGDHGVATELGELGADQQLGRYVILRELGRGGMGVVWRAYDPALDRAIAVKVLTRDVGPESRARLRSEAQAMAKLSHSNVVAVYDVATAHDTTFIAMELIDGETLRGFAARTADWRAVLAACVAGGHGLAAAHAANLVHRDFKPENVLCGRDGRVAVSDFGLARSADDVVRDASLAGTPAYMAPEQYRGEPATARSDQWSLCATTYEMLYHQRPFAAIDDDVLREPPPTSAVPRRVWRVLARGLVADPARRHGSVPALLAALVADPGVRRRRVAIAAAALVVAAGATAFAVRAMDAAAPTCEIAAAELARAWDPGARGAVDTAMQAAGGDPVRVDRALDAYAAGWTGAKRAVCEATRVRGTASERDLDMRNGCLDRARRELATLTDLFAHADRVLAARAIDAVYALRDPASCLDDHSPARSLAQRDVLDRARVLRASGRDADADALATSVLATLPPGFAPDLAAEALELRGQSATTLAQPTAEGYLFDALAAAERARDDERIAAIWIDVLELDGAALNKFAIATLAARAAAAALARIDSNPGLELSYAQTYGGMLLSQGKPEEARPWMERAVALADADTARPGEAGLARVALCNIERVARDFAAARAQCTAAVGELAAAYGPDNVVNARAFMSSGILEFDARQFPAGERELTRAIELFERTHHTDLPEYASAIYVLGTGYMDSSQVARALPLFERARDLYAAHAPHHPRRVYPLLGLADAAYQRGELATSIADYEQALTLVDGTYASDSPIQLTVRYDLSNVYTEHGDLDRASALLDEVIARATVTGADDWLGRALEGKATVADKRKDFATAIARHRDALAAFDRRDDPYRRAWTQLMLGDTYLKHGEPARAVDPAEHAVAYFSADTDAAYEQASAQFVLAQALWRTQADRAHAAAVGRDSLATLARADATPATAALQRDVRAWLAGPH